MNSQILNTMQDYIDDVEDTLSLSNFCTEDDTIGSEKHFTQNQTSSSSSSSSSLSDEDFLGFFSEESSQNTSYGNSPENIIFCGKVVSSRRPIPGDRKQETKRQTNPLFRSNSDSFRSMRVKAGVRPSTSRSKSLPNKSASLPFKSRFLVFMFGSGSGKFPAKMDMGDIKSRQLRRQSSIAVVDGGKEESGGKKGWWRLVDVLGCGGGYERDTVGVGAMNNFCDIYGQADLRVN